MAMSLNFSQNVSFISNNSSNTTPQAATSHYILETELSKKIRYVLLGVIFVLTLVGNITVCVIPYKNRRMRTFTYFLVTNLSVSDAAGIIYLPFIIYYTGIGEWPFGQAMCKLVNPSITFFGIVTTNTLVAIALDRFVALVFPFKSRPGHRETVLVIALVWLIAFLCVLPAFAVRVVKDGFCVEVFPGQTKEKRIHYKTTYNTFLYLINNCLPVVIIMLIYVKIVMQLKRNSVSIPKEKKSSWKHRNKQLNGEREREQLQTSSEKNISLSYSTDVESLRKRHKMEKEFTNMLIAVVLVFVFCYVPYQTLFFVADFVPAVYAWKYLYVVYPYLYVLMWLPNAINPICYGSMNEQYAKAFKSLLRCTSQSQVYLRGRLNSLSHVPNTAFLSLSSRSNATKEPLQPSSAVFSSETPENNNAGADSCSGNH